MSKLTATDIEKIAHLAKLRIVKDEIDHHCSDMNNILNFVEHINEIDTSDITPMAHPQNLHQRLREDEVLEFDQRDQWQKIAPKTEAGLYLVPKVIANDCSK